MSGVADISAEARRRAAAVTVARVGRPRARPEARVGVAFDMLSSVAVMDGRTTRVYVEEKRRNSQTGVDEHHMGNSECIHARTYTARKPSW